MLGAAGLVLAAPLATPTAAHARSPKSADWATHASVLRAAEQRTSGRSRGGRGDPGSGRGDSAGWGTASTAGSVGNQQGFSVSISGNIAVAGAPGARQDAGFASFWEHEGEESWIKVATLPDPRHAKHDYYAWAVAVSSTKSGTYIAIGGNDNNGKPDRVYIYTGSGKSWHLQATIDDPGTSYKDMYGDNLAISPSTLVIGASCGPRNSGAAYIYHHEGSRWVLQDSIHNPLNLAENFFGQAVAVSGNRVMIGAVGWVYVYTYTSGHGWKRTATIANPGPSGDSFGQSVALSGSGTTAVIAAPGTPPVGAAYVYHLSGTTWSRGQKLTESGGGEFAWDLAMSGSELLVGMPIGGKPNCGAAFAYKLSGSHLVLQKEITDPDKSCTSGAKFGYAVALTGTYGVFGAPGTNNGNGANYEVRIP
jgi:hypothetical protein